MAPRFGRLLHALQLFLWLISAREVSFIRQDLTAWQDTSEAYAERSYFYVGGQYVNISSLSDNTTATYMTGQIYVERLRPFHVRQEYPLVFISGNGNTGTNWLNTPDGRPGWASHFLEQGFVIYLTDQAQRGRSPWLPGDGELSSFSVDTVEKQFTAAQDFPSYPQAINHTQWPGSGRAGDPVFDAFYATQVPAQSNASLQANYNNVSYAALLDQIGPAIVLAHSQGGPFGFKLADVRPGLVKGLIAIEPEGPPFENYAGLPFDPSYIRPAANRARDYGVTMIPIEYDPPVEDAAELRRQNVSAPNANQSSCILQAEPARRLANISKVPLLFVTSEASYHAVYDHCTVAYLRQAGVEVDLLELGKEGIHGHGHFMFLEKENLVIAERIVSWILQLQSPMGGLL